MIPVTDEMRDAAATELFPPLDPEQLYEELEAIGISGALFANEEAERLHRSLWERATPEARESEPGQRLKAWLDMCQLADLQDRGDAEIDILAQRIFSAWKLAGLDNIWIMPHLLIDQDAYQSCVRALPDVLPDDWQTAIEEWEWAFSRSTLSGAAVDAALLALATAIAKRRFAAAGYQVQQHHPEG